MVDVDEAFYHWYAEYRRTAPHGWLTLPSTMKWVREIWEAGRRSADLPAGVLENIRMDDDGGKSATTDS